jgi:DNA-binding FrmR family transcriptional regulator
MLKRSRHASHPERVKRLKRPGGRLRRVVEMIEAGKPRAGIAVQLRTVGRAVTAARRMPIHDHIERWLGEGGEQDLSEMRALAKRL